MPDIFRPGPDRPRTAAAGAPLSASRACGMLRSTMEKSIWTSYFIDLEPEKAIRRFAESGWRCLELSCEHAEALLQRGDPSETGRRFGHFCKEAGVRLPQAHFKLDAEIAPEQEDERRREVEELKRWADLFTALGVRGGVLHPGGRSTLKGEPIEEAPFRRNVRSLGELARHAAGGPLTICLENGPRAEELVRLIEAVGEPNLGICLDTGHLALIRHQSPELGQTEREFIRAAGPHLKALHLADNDGSGDQHLLPFDGGCVNWAEAMRALGETGWDGALNFEIPGEIDCGPQEKMARLERATQIAGQLLELARGAPRQTIGE